MKNDKPKSIYAIQCVNTNRIYVGCSADVDSRLRQHFRELSKGIKTMRISQNVRGNTPWQDDYEKYGQDSFKAFILERDISSDVAADVEKSYILKYRSNEMEYGYNYIPIPRPNIEICEGLPFEPATIM